MIRKLAVLPVLLVLGCNQQNFTFDLRPPPDASSRSGLVALMTPQLRDWAFANCQLEGATSRLDRVVRHDDFESSDADVEFLAKNKGPHRARFSNLLLVSEMGENADRWFFACPVLPERTDEDRGLQKYYLGHYPKQPDGTPKCEAKAPAPSHGTFVVFRLRPAEEVVPTIPNGTKVHHFRVAEVKGESDPVASVADPDLRTHPGSTFAAPSECLLKCERDALLIDAQGKPGVPAKKWVTAHCPFEVVRFVPKFYIDTTDEPRDIAWDESGDASLYWKAIGLDGAPSRADQRP